MTVSDQENFSQIALENGIFETRVTRKFDRRKLFEKIDPGIVKAVIPGVVSEIGTQVGKAVRKGDVLMTLEAMKMLNWIMAPQNGTIKSIRVAAGEKVTKGQVLIEIA
jgi:biotin carboxyl carrier protein